MTRKQYTKRSIDVRREFERKGKSFRAWAIEHGYHPNLVYAVLQGDVKGKRGKGHEIAVLLGMKEGEIAA